MICIFINNFMIMIIIIVIIISIIIIGFVINSSIMMILIIIIIVIVIMIIIIVFIFISHSLIEYNNSILNHITKFFSFFFGNSIKFFNLFNYFINHFR